MAVPPASTPIIVGVGDIKNKSTRLEDAREPLELMLQAIKRAIDDACLGEDDVLPQVDSNAVVPPWTWPYPDLPALIASKLGVSASHMHIGTHGGNQPALLCDEAARHVSSGGARVAIITGGEALASLAACEKAGKMPPPGWTPPDMSGSSIRVGDLKTRPQNIGTLHEMGLPIHVYPLYENAMRASRRQTFAQNHAESAELYAAFDRVACRHEYSWRAGETPRSAEEIGRVTKRNRMICSPYPLLMNAFNTVNLAAAAIVTTVGHAQKLGIPQDKWIYVLGGAGTSESASFWERPYFHRSPALEQSIDAAIKVSGLTAGDIDACDFYSCFPIVPKLACQHLGLDITTPSKPITLLGGLTSFGGAGNNYSMHAITEATRQMRKGSFRNSLILANGGVFTYQHALCLSSSPRTDDSPYPRQAPLAITVSGIPAPAFDERANGPASIEAYTVEFGRDGRPQMGLIVGRLKGSGHRFIANHGDERTLGKMSDESAEPVGLQGRVETGSDGRNRFFLQADGKL